MHEVQQILNRLNLIDKSITNVIQHSHHPDKNITIQFYAFENQVLKYIVSTYREENSKRLSSEKASMKKLFEFIDSDIKKNILFSLELFRTDQILYRVQKYHNISQQYSNNVKNIDKIIFNQEFFKNILVISNDWVYKLQNMTLKHQQQEKKIDLGKDITIWKEKNRKNEKIMLFLDRLLSLAKNKNLKPVETYLHGDFCYWNYFIGDDNLFYVFDWECMREKGYTFIDPFTNVLVFWMVLYRVKTVASLSSILSKQNNGFEKILIDEIYRLCDRYSINTSNIKTIFAYTYCSVFFKQDSLEENDIFFKEMFLLISEEFS